MVARKGARRPEVPSTSTLGGNARDQSGITGFACALCAESGIEFRVEKENHNHFLSCVCLGEGEGDAEAGTALLDWQLLDTSLTATELDKLVSRWKERCARNERGLKQWKGEVADRARDTNAPQSGVEASWGA